jgi:hypothetical protein
MVLAGISSTRPSSDNQRPFLDRAILWLRPRNIARYTHRVFPETKQHRSSIEHGTLVQKKRKAGISALASEFCTLLFRFYSAAWISTHLSNIPPLGSFSYSFFFFVVFLFVNTASVDFNCFHCFDSPGNTASLVATTAASSAFFHTHNHRRWIRNGHLWNAYRTTGIHSYKRAFFFFLICNITFSLSFRF